MYAQRNALLLRDAEVVLATCTASADERGRWVLPLRVEGAPDDQGGDATWGAAGEHLSSTQVALWDEVRPRYIPVIACSTC